MAKGRGPNQLCLRPGREAPPWGRRVSCDDRTAWVVTPRPDYCGLTSAGPCLPDEPRPVSPCDVLSDRTAGGAARVAAAGRSGRSTASLAAGGSPFGAASFRPPRQRDCTTCCEGPRGADLAAAPVRGFGRRRRVARRGRAGRVGCQLAHRVARDLPVAPHDQDSPVPDPRLAAGECCRAETGEAGALSPSGRRGVSRGVLGRVRSGRRATSLSSRGPGDPGLGDDSVVGSAGSRRNPVAHTTASTSTASPSSKRALLPSAATSRGLMTAPRRRRDLAPWPMTVPWPRRIQWPRREP